MASDKAKVAKKRGEDSGLPSWWWREFMDMDSHPRRPMHVNGCMSRLVVALSLPLGPFDFVP
jgi:hypothetical protein